MTPLRDAMRFEAGWVWRAKARAASLGVFLNEETITETILLRLAMAAQGTGFLVRPFTKAEETKSGADWEFRFISRSKMVGLRVQAKRLFPSGRYDSLKPGGVQTAELIRQAGRCTPVFVFYNDATHFSPTSVYCACGAYRAPSYRGCLVALATNVASVASNDAKAIERVSIPWHCLFCKHTHKPLSLPDLISENIQSLRPGLAASTKVDDDLFDDRTRGLAASARDEPIPEWLARYLTENTLAGLVLFAARDTSLQ